MCPFPRRGPGGACNARKQWLACECLKGDNIVIPSANDQERLAVVIPLFAPRRHTQPDRGRTAVATGEPDRDADRRAESMRKHPSNRTR